MKRPKILIVEDQSIIAKDLQTSLVQLGYEVNGIASSGEEAIEKAEYLEPDLVLMDIVLQGEIDGIEAATVIRERLSKPVIFLTAHSDKPTLERAKKSEPYGYIVKPFQDRDLYTSIEIALYKHKVEKQIQETLQRLELALETGNMGIWDYELLSQTMKRSLGEYAIFGQAMGDTDASFDAFLQQLHPGDREPVLNTVKEAIRTTGKFSIEFRILHPDGDLHWIAGKGKVFSNAQGVPIRLIGVNMDITERRQAEEALRQSEEEYRLLVDGVSDYAIFMLDQKGNVSSWNTGAERIFGYTAAEILGAGFEVFFTPHDIEHRRPKQELQNARLSKRAISEGWHVRKDGSTFWATGTTTAIRTSDGRMKSFVKICRDITERRKNEEALIESEGRFRTLIEHSSDVMTLLGEDGTIFYSSPSTVRILGYDVEEEFVNHQISEFISPEDLSAPHNPFSAMLEQSGSGSNHHFRMRHKNGSWLWMEGVVNNKLEDPSIRGIIVNYRDITERKRAEEENRRLNTELEEHVSERTRQLEEAVRELEAFSYSVSHDLRAPLRAINGFANALVEDYSTHIDEEGKRHLQTIRRSALEMSELIDDLLAFSRLSRAELKLSHIDMTELARSVIGKLQANEPERPMNIVLQPLASANGDPALLRQVLINLLSNAFKFTRYTKMPTIEVGSISRDGEYIYCIRDNGAGFDMNYAGKLFGVFQRLHPADEFEGTGVGLAIVQRIVHRHGGRVWAEGKEHEGSTFYFTLPARG